MTTHVVSPVEFDSTEIGVSGSAHHHLFRVKRLGVGDEVRIVDGEGRARRAVVARVDRAHAVLALGSAEPSRESPLALELLVAPPKPDRAAWLVEKATELGARAVRFVLSERAARGERAFGPAQILRLHRVAIAAVEQCGRARVPEVSGPHPLGEALDRLAAPASGPADLLVLDPGGDPAERWAAEVAPAAAVLVGPEGGWTAAELEALDRRGGRRIGLGERVLRVETAAVAACALLLVPRASA
jgi:16S rRNA (uracil1498-N3)-methyltransferase